MYELLFITLGVIAGSIITQVILRFRAGHGYFVIEELSPDDDLYTINMRLTKDQNLHKKKRIILIREYISSDSQK